MSGGAVAAHGETLDAYLSVALSVAHAAGRLLLRTWRMHPNDRGAYDTKSSSADVVTETDRDCERVVYEGIRAAFPHHRFIGEESHTTEGRYDLGPPGTTTWVVDPIDGTNNFIKALPSVAVSVGVMRDGEVLVGVVHCPVFGETYFATRGGGAWVASVQPDAAAVEAAVDRSRAVRLRTSLTQGLSSACVATEMGYNRSHASIALMQAKTGALLVDGLQSLRCSGSCCVNMVHVAAGKLDAYYEGESPVEGPRPWDVCAASLIVREAGGVVCDVYGGAFSWNGRVLAAANQQMANEIVQRMKRAKQQCAQADQLASKL